jgi:hypothetical protein
VKVASKIAGLEAHVADHPCYMPVLTLYLKGQNTQNSLFHLKKQHVKKVDCNE